MKEQFQEPRISIGTRIELQNGVSEVVKIHGERISNGLGDSYIIPIVTLKPLDGGKQFEVDGEPLARLI